VSRQKREKSGPGEHQMLHCELGQQIFKHAPALVAHAMLNRTEAQNMRWACVTASLRECCI
jgi:hypothetical protein